MRLQTNRTIAGLAVFGTTAIASAQVSTILVDEDYMTSGFFQSNFVRGQEADSTRAVNRASPTTIFGVTGETAYFSFDFDPAAFSGPVEQAIFSVEVVANGFFADPSAGAPVDVSLHSLTAEPLATIDINAPSGPGSWIDFRDSQITTSSIVATTTLDGLGVFDWDITALVNDWIANGNANFAFTLGASTLLDDATDQAIGFVNSSSASLGGELTARISIVPTPGMAAIAAVAGGLAGSRRRRG